MFNGFYRATAATLCVSAVFAVARCLSVRLSRCMVYSIHTAEDIVKLFSPPGSPITLVFWSPTPIHNSNGNPFSGGRKIHGGGKSLRFSTEIAVYLGSHICALSNDDMFNDLRGPLSPFSRSRHFFISNISKTFFDPRLIYVQVTIEQ